MNDKITILFLSDLHISGTDNNNQRKLLDKLSAILKQLGSVDYIVVAGDIVNNTAESNASELYGTAAEIIDSLCSQCRIEDKTHLIIVPGNHDKKRNKKNDDDAQRFFKSSMCKEELTADDVASFTNYYKSCFEEFCSFNRKYCTHDYYWDKEIFGDDINSGLGSVQGYKVFDSHKVIFFCVNTEWNRWRNDDTSQNVIPSSTAKTMKEIAEKYPAYHVITVMHRSPFNLGWNDQYAEFSSVKPIYDHSEIIVAGHFHSHPFFPPHRMTNSAQLVILGTTSAISKDDKKHQAALMKIDTFYNEMHFVNLEFDEGAPDDGKWIITKDSNQTYQLSSKLFSSFKGSSRYYVEGFHSGLPFTCISKSGAEEDIRRAILSYYGIDSDYVKIIPVDSTSKTDGKVTRKPAEFESDVILFVVYGIADHNLSDIIINTRISCRVDALREDFANEIILGRVVIQKAFIKISEHSPDRLPDSFCSACGTPSAIPSAVPSTNCLAPQPSPYSSGL